jgi:hypothetical protein
MHRRESYDRWRGRRSSGWPRHSMARRRAQASTLPTSTATALQELGLIVPEQVVAPTGRSTPRGAWEAVEPPPQSVLFLLSFTCFGLLLALLAWHPWR